MNFAVADLGHVDDGLVWRGRDDAAVLQVLVRQLVVQTEEVGEPPRHRRLCNYAITCLTVH